MSHLQANYFKYSNQSACRSTSYRCSANDGTLGIGLSTRQTFGTFLPVGAVVSSTTRKRLITPIAEAKDIRHADNRLVIDKEQQLC